MKMNSECRYESPQIVAHKMETCSPLCNFSDIEDEETQGRTDEEEIEESCGRRGNVDSLW